MPRPAPNKSSRRPAPQRHRPRARPKHEFADAERGERIQRVMADAGVASRRHCELLVLQGHVTVNGQRINTLPAWVDPKNDRIEVDGVPLSRPKGRAGAERKIYVILHKPRNVISTTSDPEGRRNVLDLVDMPATTAKRLFPVGRLDADSTGLMLLTNDGDLANQLTHPRFGIEKQYEVSIRGRLTSEDVATLTSGLMLAHQRSDRRQGVQVKRAAMEQVELLGYQRDESRGDRTNLRITLREGQNREIRRLLAKLGLSVRRLKRVAIGPLKLKGLAVGEWRLLIPHEIKLLREATTRAHTQ